MPTLASRKQIVHIEGLTDLQHTLTKTMPREARNILRRTVVRIAKGVREDMRDTVRQNGEDEGTLRRAIRHKRHKGDRESAEAAVFITHGQGAKYDAFYWHMVEFGQVSGAPLHSPDRESMGSQTERRVSQ